MKKRFYLIPFISLIILYSCVEQKIEPAAQTDNEIVLARNWFDQNSANNQKGKITSRLSVADLQWDHAISFRKNNIEIIEVPINATNKRASIGQENSKDLLSKLVIFKRANKYESAILEIIPSDEFLESMGGDFVNISLKGLNKNFSGLVNFLELNSNEVRAGYWFERGRILGKMSKSYRANSKGRLDYYEITTTYWTCSMYGCFVDSQSTSIYPVYTPDQNVYDQSLDPNDQYGGGGGSSDPSETPIELEFNINVDPSITSDPKANCIYNKLLNNEKFNEILKAFENNGSLNVTFKLGELPGAGLNGVTRTSSPYNNIEIIIDYTNLQNHRTIEAARSFLHEAVHAKIYGYMYLNGNRSYEELNEMNFPELWDAYVIAKANGTSPQHELMANMYIDLIADGLRLFDIRNHNNPAINIDHYRALAWQGLKSDNGIETEAYSLLTASQKTKIADDLKFIRFDCFCSVINCE